MACVLLDWTRRGVLDIANWFLEGVGGARTREKNKIWQWYIGLCGVVFLWSGLCFALSRPMFPFPDLDFVMYWALELV